MCGDEAVGRDAGGGGVVEGDGAFGTGAFGFGVRIDDGGFAGGLRRRGPGAGGWRG